MFKTTGSSQVSELLRKYAQEDLVASGIRVGLSVAGPVGVVLGEFLTQFVPAQRIDRLQEYAEFLAERMTGLEDQFRERLEQSAGFSSLAEAATSAAVRNASTELRRDLASILRDGLSRTEVEMIDQHSLLVLRERLNDAQVLILMSYANFKRTMRDDELDAFRKEHSALFDFKHPALGDPPEVLERWQLFEYQEDELVRLGLLEDKDGIVRDRSKHRKVTGFGKILLRSIGRYRDPYG